MKRCFRIVQNEKVPFEAIKILIKTNFKQSKNCHFSKEVSPQLWSKNRHFSILFLGKIGQKNMFYYILERKIAFRGYIKKFKKVKKLTFSRLFERVVFIEQKGVLLFQNIGKDTMVLIPKWPFFQLFFLANIGQINVFYHILERKNALQGYKNNKFKKSKN